MRSTSIGKPSGRILARRARPAGAPSGRVRKPLFLPTESADGQDHFGKRAPIPRTATLILLLLFAPLRVLRDTVVSILTFPESYRAWRILQDALNRQLKEHYERKGMPYVHKGTGSVRPR